jgi:general secretion pathway protein A
LTGEVGTGKTLVLRCLLQLFRQNNDVAYAYIFNGRLSPVEFLEYVASDFGLPAAGKNKGELLLDLGSYVIGRAQRKLTTVLVVDEAHHLSADILEEIRLLTNLETAHDKLLQILLVGQPELDDKLDSVGLRQLKQRIALRSRLEPLDPSETRGYIERRLQLAGASSSEQQVFQIETIADVYHYSRGIPRLINTICENALIAGYARQMHSITPDIIDDIAADFRLGVAHQFQAERPKEVEGTDLRMAAKTLLDLHSYLQKPLREMEDRTPVVPRVIKQ